MRMPPPHLVLERSRHRLGVEFATLFSDHDLERDVQQQIAQLVTQPGGVVLLEGLIELERFFHEIRAQRVARLDAVPGAARAQVAHQRERAGEGGVTRHRVSEAAGVAGNLAGGLSYARL